jgi:hypothetical protein
MRLLLAIGLACALGSTLGGCGIVAVPPAVTIASYAADGISYLATGKSLSDNAVSEVADEDCVLLRAAMMRNPCQPYPVPDSELAVELETSYGGEDVSTELAEADLAAGPGGARTMVASRRHQAPTALASAAPARTAAKATAPARATAEPRYVVVGSFRERANAERARRANAANGAAIVPVAVHGQAWYRVIARPGAGSDGAHWAIAPCGAAAGPGPCLDRAGLAMVDGGTKRATAIAERRSAAPARQLSERPMTSSRAREIGG